MRTVQLRKFNSWEQWRKENNTRKEMGDPKESPFKMKWD